MTRQLWIRNSHATLGPYTVQQVRAMAKVGNITSGDFLSEDGQHWTPLERVTGLFEASHTSAHPPVATSAVPRASVAHQPVRAHVASVQTPWQDSAADSPITSSTFPTASLVHQPVSAQVASGQTTWQESAEPPWPVIRRDKAGFLKRKRYVRIRPTDIAWRKDKRRITDEILLAEESDARPRVYRTIRKYEIQSVKITQMGRYSVSSLWYRFIIRSDNKKIRFQVPERELENVESAMRMLAGDKMPAKYRKRTAFIEWVLLLIVFLWLAAVVGMLATDNLLIGGISLGTLAAFVCLIFLCLRLDIWRTDLKRHRPRRPKKHGSTRQRPFRSPTLGWILKSAGILYLIIGSAASDSILSGSKDASSLAAAGLIVSLPGLGLLILGYRLCLRTFSPESHPDPRQPVLFLRGFADDGKWTLQPQSFLARCHGIFSFSGIWRQQGVTPAFLHPVKLFKMFLNVDNYSAEELLASEFRHCGPFVAIGKPGERLAAAGADRMYVADNEWKGTVLEYLRVSQAVILQPSYSDGIRWEINTVLSRPDRTNVLLSMLSFVDRPNDYEYFRQWMRREHQINLKACIPFQDTPDFIYFDADHQLQYQPVCKKSPLLWTCTGNAIDLTSTFFTFIQGLGGRPRSAPRQPVRYFGHGVLSVIPMILVGFGILALKGFADSAFDSVAQTWSGGRNATDESPAQAPSATPTAPEDNTSPAQHDEDGVKTNADAAATAKVYADPARLRDIRDLTAVACKASVQEILDAANSGDTNAMVELGLSYDNGIGFVIDVQRAIEWYKKAALQGNMHGMYCLGNSYKIGRGVDQDRDQAIAWFQKAAGLGDEDAKNALSDLGLQPAVPR